MLYKGFGAEVQIPNREFGAEVLCRHGREEHERIAEYIKHQLDEDDGGADDDGKHLAPVYGRQVDRGWQRPTRCAVPLVTDLPMGIYI